MSALGEQGRGGQRAGAPAPVHGVHAAALGFVVDGEGVASHAVHVRADDGKHARHGDGGINGVAAPAQHFVARGRSERVAGRYGAADAAHVRAVGGGEDHLAGGLSRGARLGGSFRGLARRRNKEAGGQQGCRGPARVVLPHAAECLAHRSNSWVPSRRTVSDVEDATAGWSCASPATTRAGAVPSSARRSRRLPTRPPAR